MAPQSHHHRPTLKQSNKGFKSRHATKGARKASAKGKTASLLSPSATHKAVDAGNKKARLNQQAQKREAKIRAGREDGKFFSTSSSGGKVPRIVSVIPLLDSVSCTRFIHDLFPALGLSEDEIESIDEQSSSIVINASKFKTKLHLNMIPPHQLYPALDAALVSDAVVLLLSSKDEVGPEGDAILRCLQGQAGAANVIPCVQSPESEPLTNATRPLVQKSLLSFTRYFFPSVNKVYCSETPADAILIGRALCEASPPHIRHPDGRAWLVSEDTPTWEPADATDTEEQLGNLRVTGTIRGGRLSANRLVHLPGEGDFQLSEIIAASTSVAGGSRDSIGERAPSTCLSRPNESTDDLTANNVPDLLANEQTWPTEEEMMGEPNVAAAMATSKNIKRVPKGTSAYQAAWIFDDDNVSGGDDDDSVLDTDVEGGLGSEKDSDSGTNEREEMEDIELDSGQDDHDEMTMEEEESQYEAYRRDRQRAQQEDMAFPDEIDTPRHVAARERFQRYRGLRSFRTSPWDAYENLPLDYGEIFQFENFAATEKRVQHEAQDDGVEVGTRVTLVIKNVPKHVGLRMKAPLIVHGLLRHEHKQTVLHFAVQRNTEYAEPVRAKDPLVLCVGPRRYLIHPLFSQHVRGGGKGVNNVHKSERFLRHGSTAVATTYGPVCFGKQPCLLLKPGPNQQVPDLVAMGSFLSSDPSRIIAKRIVLTGHPFKVHKKTATIRYMFFNREDVDYFRTVELHTKYGRTGHIKEALGTHGYFKAHFDGPIQQMDTICMNLYKRQFPKWSETFQPPAVCDDGEAESMDVE